MLRYAVVMQNKRKKVSLRLGASLLALLAATAMAQPDPTPIMDNSAASPNREARAALEAFNFDRLVSDRRYAEEILRHVEMLDADAAQQFDAEDRAGIRLMALAALDRGEEARAGIDQLVVAGPRAVQPYIDALLSALILRDNARAVGVLEVAGRRVRGVDWPELRRRLGPEIPRTMFMRLVGDGGRPLRVRLATALLRIGWSGDSDRVIADDLRMMLVDDRLALGDAGGAAEIASTVRTPPLVLSLILLRRYDAVIGADRDRLAMFRAALADEDRETTNALNVREPSLDHKLARARYLRAVGRNAEAWALIEPTAHDVAATVALGSNGLWLVDQGVGVLYALGHKDEAVALGRRLVAVPLAANHNLINIYINHIDFLLEAGLYAEALDHARRVQRDHSGAANAYGRMWISEGIVCALAGLGRAGEAAPVLARMRASSQDNLAAMVRAHLCLGDMAAAEPLMIQRLEAEDTGLLVINSQTFEIDTDAPETASPGIRMSALRERPAVRAALDRVARTLPLPLAEFTWY